MSHHMTVEDSQQVGIAITALFKKILTKMSDSRRIRSTIKELNKLSDRELSDIGIHRGMIYTVAHQIDANPNLRGWV